MTVPNRAVNLQDSSLIPIESIGKHYNNEKKKMTSKQVGHLRGRRISHCHHPSERAPRRLPTWLTGGDDDRLECALFCYFPLFVPKMAWDVILFCAGFETLNTRGICQTCFEGRRVGGWVGDSKQNRQQTHRNKHPSRANPGDMTIAIGRLCSIIADYDDTFFLWEVLWSFKSCLE